MNCVKIKQNEGFNVNLETSLNSDVMNNRYQTSINPGNYILQNNYNCNGINDINSFANNNLGFMARDGCGVNPNNINKDTYIKHSNLTNYNNINQLFPRSINTLPLLRRKMDLNADTLIRSPEYSDNSKSFKTVSDQDFNRFTPLVSHLRNNVQNPIHIIPENSLNYWKQGGISTRDLVKNTNYIENLQKFRLNDCN